MIEATGIRKSFDGRSVLEGVDLRIEDGKTFVVIGPSGQGKTVLVKILASLVRPDSGSVRYDGREIFHLSRKSLWEVRKETAFVFQGNALFDFLDVADNLGLYLKMHDGLAADAIAARVEEALTFVGLDDSVMSKFPAELSEGMAKRVAIARSLIVRPRVIFYDEPTSGLDEGSAAKVVDLMIRLRSEISATSVVVTHEVALMRRIADSVALLKRGSVIFAGAKEEVSEPMLHDLYFSGENDAE